MAVWHKKCFLYLQNTETVKITRLFIRPSSNIVMQIQDLQ